MPDKGQSNAKVAVLDINCVTIAEIPKTTAVIKNTFVESPKILVIPEAIKSAPPVFCNKEMRGLDRYREQPKEYKYHNPYDDWIFRQLADIDNRKNIPDTSPQVDFNEGDYEDYLKAKWNRGF